MHHCNTARKEVVLWEKEGKERKGWVQWGSCEMVPIDARSKRGRGKKIGSEKSGMPLYCFFIRSPSRSIQKRKCSSYFPLS